ncbi:MAG TPA: DUF3892 domain-containing protein [Candidatus Nanoarchaeia archaeon]|nr:DUF3892 domain-containing protein [Candidatus Nanoarchaeia archaeon]
MTKWSDYAIIAVQFRKEKRHIDKVKIREDNGDKLVNEQIVSRDNIVNTIERGIKFITVYNKQNQWTKGDDIKIVLINNTKFIRTDGNRIEEDNLGELPEMGLS